MRLLLDTHYLLWSQVWPHKLPKKALSIILDDENDLLFSSISLAEIAIKHSLGRQDFPVDPVTVRDTLLDNGYNELPLTGEHAVLVGGLPSIHKDPFDRMLIAQAIAEEITLLTNDTVMARYAGPVRLV